MAKKKKSKAAADSDAPQAPPAPPVPRPPVDPKWCWPPFPTPPEGVAIIPFKDFIPKGIIIDLNADEDVERDGDGIPTVVLQVKHTIGALGRPAGSKKKQGPLAAMTEEELKRITWNQRWELGEDLRTAQPINPYVARLFNIYINITNRPCLEWKHFQIGSHTPCVSFIKAASGIHFVRSNGITYLFKIHTIL